jgi:serine/threonine protein kinase
LFWIIHRDIKPDNVHDSRRRGSSFWTSLIASNISAGIRIDGAQDGHG